MLSQFVRLSLIVLLTITFLPATSQALSISARTEVGHKDLDAWWCFDNGTFDDPNLSSSFVSCGGDVGNLLAGAGSASAFATPPRAGWGRARYSYGNHSLTEGNLGKSRQVWLP